MCYIFGGMVKAPLTSVTPTFLTSGVLSQIREADYVAHQVSLWRKEVVTDTGERRRSGGGQGCRYVVHGTAQMR